jgi:nucleoid-associated protein YgaU
VGRLARGAERIKHLFDFVLAFEHAFGDTLVMTRTGVRPTGRQTVICRRRLASALVAAAVGLSTAGLLAGHAAAGPNPGAARPVKSTRYVVRPGDTIWGIAQRVAGPEADPRPLVDALVALNHVRGGAITPGERLVVPSRPLTG